MTWFGLEFETPYSRDGKRGWGSAEAYVVVTNYPRSPKHIKRITTTCMSIEEIESQVGQLKRELDEVVKRARAKFADHDQREQRWKEQSRGLANRK